MLLILILIGHAKTSASTSTLNRTLSFSCNWQKKRVEQATRLPASLRSVVPHSSCCWECPVCQPVLAVAEDKTVLPLSSFTSLTRSTPSHR
jgi:hypothetical protein